MHIHGRTGRLAYAACVLLLFFPAAALWWFGFTVLALPFALGLLVATGRRLHDVGRSAWWSLLLALPGVALLTMLVLIFWPGNAGENRFGLPSGKAVSAA